MAVEQWGSDWEQATAMVGCFRLELELASVG